MNHVSRHQLEEIPESGLDDSGLRHVYQSGAMRERAFGKGRYDLLSPLAEACLAQHMEKGTVKYDERNWEGGMPLGDYVDSTKRHLDMLMLGDTKEPHAVAAMWNLHCLVHTMEMIRLGLLPEELDNLPKYLQQAPWEDDETVDDLPTTSSSADPGAYHDLTVPMPIPGPTD